MSVQQTSFSNFIPDLSFERRLELRQRLRDFIAPGSYSPGLTEFKGTLNLILGAMASTVAVGLDIYGNQEQAKVHSLAGTRLTAQGIRDLTPAVVAVAATCFAYNAINSIDSTN